MSTLLEQASLVLIPSGYKEDVVYSQIPTSGAGDLSFTRASNGTRVNSAGLVEVCPWNLVTYSNDFSNAVWNKNNINLTSGQTDKDGGTNAWKVDFTGSANSAYMFQELPAGQKTGAVWVKGTAGQTAFIGIQASVGSNLFTFDGTWQQIVQTTTDIYYVFSNYGASATATTFLMQYVQANIGTTLKPYFPTTDRLNVPRLTYQNGGGGCPSLLLEKQSTNRCTYSEDFSNAAWNKVEDSGCSITITPNYTTASNGLPAARLVASRTNTSTLAALVNYATNTSTSSTKSIWMKNNNAGNVTIMFGDEAVTITDSWERYSVTNTYLYLIVGLRYSGVALTCDISITGSQFELGSYATSYIPTTSASATRVADECTKNGIGALIGGTSGTVFFDIKTNPVLSSANYKQFCYYLDSASAQSYMYLNDVNQIVTNSNWGSLSYATAFQPNTRYKVALVYAPNDFALYVNGVSVATASSGTPKDNVNISIGQFSGTENCEFVFNQYTHFKSRLTNAELASLTTI
jgi:hypothetical protein